MDTFACCVKNDFQFLYRTLHLGEKIQQCWNVEKAMLCPEITSAKINFSKILS